MIDINYVLLEEDGCKGIAPIRMTDDASCYDLSLPKDVWLPPHRIATIPLLIAFDVLTPGYDIELFPRSSLQTKYGVLSSTSIIDSDYKRTIHAILFNTGCEVLKLLQGMRIVQFKVVLKHDISLVEVEHIKDTGRGGLGSTDDKR